MPISIRFLLPVFEAIKLIRFEPGFQWHYPRPGDTQQMILALELAKRLPPHLKRDVLRDE